jgi:hypothetical protein
VRVLAITFTRGQYFLSKFDNKYLTCKISLLHNFLLQLVTQKSWCEGWAEMVIFEITNKSKKISSLSLLAKAGSNPDNSIYAPFLQLDLQGTADNISISVISRGIVRS